MDHHHHHHHQAVDGLVSLLTKANHDLDAVQLKLEREFQQLYPDNANPMKLVYRIKKVQEELSTLKEQCLELLAAKQDLIDKARTVLVSNRNLLQRMQLSIGIPCDGVDEDPAFANLNQQTTKINKALAGLMLVNAQMEMSWIINEWTTQVRSATGDEEHDSESKDVNKLLFSAIVQGN